MVTWCKILILCHCQDNSSNNFIFFIIVPYCHPVVEECLCRQQVADEIHNTVLFLIIRIMHNTPMDPTVFRLVGFRLNGQFFLTLAQNRDTSFKTYQSKTRSVTWSWSSTWYFASITASTLLAFLFNHKSLCEVGLSCWVIRSGSHVVLEFIQWCFVRLRPGLCACYPDKPFLHGPRFVHGGIIILKPPATCCHKV